MIRFCLGDEVTLSPHELTLVHEIEAAYGHSIVSMTKEDFYNSTAKINPLI